MADKTQQNNKGRREETGQGGEKKSNRGFAGMDAARQREIASEGGRAAHQQGRAHEFTSEEAREAGRKGGQASGGSRRNRARAAAEARNAQGEPSEPSGQQENKNPDAPSADLDEASRPEDQSSNM